MSGADTGALSGRLVSRRRVSATLGGCWVDGLRCVGSGRVGLSTGEGRWTRSIVGRVRLGVYPKYYGKAASDKFGTNCCV